MLVFSLITNLSLHDFHSISINSFFPFKKQTYDVTGCIFQFFSPYLTMLYFTVDIFMVKVRF